MAKEHSASSWVRLKGGSFAEENVAANYASDGGPDLSPQKMFNRQRMGGTSNANPLKRTSSAIGPRPGVHNKKPTNDDPYNFYMFHLHDSRVSGSKIVFNIGPDGLRNFSNLEYVKREKELRGQADGRASSLPAIDRRKLELRMRTRE